VGVSAAIAVTPRLPRAPRLRSEPRRLAMTVGGGTGASPVSVGQGLAPATPNPMTQSPFPEADASGNGFSGGLSF